MFDGDDLNRFVRQASWLAFNDYEASLMQQRTGKTIEQLAQEVRAVIVTRGGEGSQVFLGDKLHEIPPARVGQLQDPTGCGDAYRAGLLYGLQNDLDWEVTGRIASLMGAIKIEHAGTQNHNFTFDEFNSRFQENFGFTI